MPHPRRKRRRRHRAASPHQPAYYALLAPAYEAVARSRRSPQLTAVRLVSALLGALRRSVAFGIVRELLPRQPVAAVAAGLLVAYHPMFGFISGAVNNDNGINAAAALVAVPGDPRAQTRADLADRAGARRDTRVRAADEGDRL